MMHKVNRTLLNSLLRRVTAGKEEEPAQVPDTGKMPADRKRYYFFDSPPQNSIAFTALREVLQSDSPEKDALVKKLQGGNTGPYYADYFIWKKVVVITNEYSNDGKEYVVYECDLSSIGAKITGSEKITPSNAGATAEQIEGDFLLFEDKRGNSNIITPDTSGESYYVDQDPPSNIARILMSKAVPSGNILNYGNFEDKFDQYRIWVPTLNQLLLPDFEVPRTDDVQGGHYVGGEASYKKLVAPYEKKDENKKEETPNEPLGDSMKEDKEAPEFEPVPGRIAPEKGNIIDRVPGKKSAQEKEGKREKGDYSSEPYSGGTDVMQRLVRDQKKHMKIRNAARRVMAIGVPNVPGTPSPLGDKGLDPQVTRDKAKAHNETAKALEQVAKAQELSQKAQQKAEGQLGGKLASQRVISRFLEKSR